MDALCEVLSTLSIESTIEVSNSSLYLAEGYIIKLPLDVVIELPEDAAYLIIQILLRFCRDFLDFLEPLNSRLIVSSESCWWTLWSYSFSLVKWKRAICFFWPGLKKALEFHEKYLARPDTSFLRSLDKLLSSGNWSVAAVLLNTWYEGISAMENTPLVNNSAKDHVLSSLTHHLLYVYRALLPKAPNRSQRKTDAQTLALSCNMFSQTIDLLPARWRINRRGRFTRSILQSCRKPSMLRETVEVRPGIASSRNSRQQLELPAPLRAYFPSGFLDLFGLVTEEQQALEADMQGFISSHYPSLQEEMLGLSHWIIGVGLGVFSSLMDGEDTSEKWKLSILYCIIAGSQYVWNDTVDFYNQFREVDGLILSDLVTDRKIIEGLMIKSFKEIEST